MSDVSIVALLAGSGGLLFGMLWGQFAERSKWLYHARYMGGRWCNGKTYVIREWTESDSTGRADAGKP